MWNVCKNILFAVYFFIFLPFCKCIDHTCFGWPEIMGASLFGRLGLRWRDEHELTSAGSESKRRQYCQHTKRRIGRIDSAKLEVRLTLCLPSKQHSVERSLETMADASRTASSALTVPKSTLAAKLKGCVANEHYCEESGRKLQENPQWIWMSCYAVDVTCTASTLVPDVVEWN